MMDRVDNNELTLVPFLTTFSSAESPPDASSNKSLQDSVRERLQGIFGGRCEDMEGDHASHKSSLAPSKAVFNPSKRSKKMKRAKAYVSPKSAV